MMFVFHEPKIGLSSLPPELLVKILEELDWKDLVQIRQLSGLFRDIVKESVALQYRIELAAAGFRDGPSTQLDLPSKLDLLREYCSKWLPYIPDDLPAVEVDIQGNPSCFHGGYSETTDGRHISFTCCPSGLRGIEGETWFVDLNFRALLILCKPEQDLVMVVRREAGGLDGCPTFYAQALHLSGEPHEFALVSELPISSFEPTFIPEEFEIHFGVCGERLSSLLHWQGPEGSQWDFTFWDWHTGSRLCLYPSELNQLLALPQHPRQRYMTMVFLHYNQTILLGGFLEDQDGNQIGASIDVLEMLSVESKKAVRFHLPAFAPGWTPRERIVVEHRSPIAGTPDYYHQPPFQTYEGGSIVLVSFTLAKGEDTVSLSILIPSGKLLSYLKEPLRDVPSRNISWEQWGPASTRVFPSDQIDIAGARAFQIQADEGPELFIYDFGRTLSPFGKAANDRLSDFELVRDSHTLNLPAFNDPITTCLPYNLYRRSWTFGPLGGVTEDSFVIRGADGFYYCFYFP